MLNFFRVNFLKSFPTVESLCLLTNFVSCNTCIPTTSTERNLLFSAIHSYPWPATKGLITLWLKIIFNIITIIIILGLSIILMLVLRFHKVCLGFQMVYFSYESSCLLNSLYPSLFLLKNKLSVTTSYSSAPVKSWMIWQWRWWWVKHNFSTQYYDSIILW